MAKYRVLTGLLILLWTAQAVVVGYAAYVVQGALFTEGLQRPDMENEFGPKNWTTS